MALLAPAQKISISTVLAVLVVEMAKFGMLAVSAASAPMVYITMAIHVSHVLMANTGAPKPMLVAAPSVKIGMASPV